MELRLAQCSDYNGHKNILFCMEKADFRLGNGNWADKGPLVRFGKSTFIDEGGNVYKRHGDWSLTKVSIS